MPGRIANLLGEINRFNKKNQYNPNVGKFQKRQINLAGNSRHKVYENQARALGKNSGVNDIQSRGVINRNSDNIKFKNIRKFAENHEVLKRQKEVRNLRIDTSGGRKLGEGSFGEVRELKNNRDYVVKIPHAGNYYEAFVINKAAKGEFEKAEKIREIINNYIKRYDFGGAQSLDNVAAPVRITQGQNVYGKTNELVMPKVEGKDGDKAIFGKSPLKMYGNKTKDNSFSINPEEKGKALSVALQKVMILRALNEAGYANIDTKLENIMISEDGKVSMIDIGSVEKHGTKISGGFTPATAAPEIWNGNTQASSQADVFSDAIDRPYILFGEIAKKHIPQFPKMNKNDINDLHDVDKYHKANFIAKSCSARGNFKDIVVPVSWKFMSYEKAIDLDVKNEMKKYEDAGFQKPTFPKDFTNAQKMRYMYYHLGFLKIQKEIGEVYPPKVIDSLAKLQALATEPDPNERLSCKDVEDTLLHLMMSADKWGKGVFRIDGMKVTPWSMPDQILPKNNVEAKKVFHRNNRQKEIKKENIQRPAKVTPNRNRNIVNNKSGNVDLRNIVKNQTKNKNVAAKIGEPKKAKVPPLFNKRFGNWFVDPQKREQKAPKAFGQKQNVKGNKILNNVLNNGANNMNDTLHQNFGDQLNGTLNQKFRDEISMNHMNDTLNQSFRDQEDGQYQLNDLINDFSESDGIEQIQNTNSNKRPAFDKIFNEPIENKESSKSNKNNRFNEILSEYDGNQNEQVELKDLTDDFVKEEAEQRQNIESNKRPTFNNMIFNEAKEQQEDGLLLDDLLKDYDKKSEVEQGGNSKDREVKNEKENKSSEMTSTDFENSTKTSSIRRKYQRK